MCVCGGGGGGGCGREVVKFFYMFLSNYPDSVKSNKIQAIVSQASSLQHNYCRNELVWKTKARSVHLSPSSSAAVCKIWFSCSTEQATWPETSTKAGQFTSPKTLRRSSATCTT